MCGRYSLTITKAALQARFPGALGDPPHEPRYNIAPSQSAPILAAPKGERRWAAMQWGFSMTDGGRLINARAETLTQRPMFRGLLDRFRALVPADGFYEWPKTASAGARPRPVRIVRRDRAPFAFAALWRQAEENSSGEFVILTTRPNALVGPFHDRMPVVLSPKREDEWLDRDRPFAALSAALFEPWDPCEWEAYAVSDAVNRSGRDDPACIDPAPPDGRRTLK